MENKKLHALKFYKWERERERRTQYVVSKPQKENAINNAMKWIEKM